MPVSASQPVANVTAILAMLKVGPFNAMQKDLKQITDLNLQKDARRLSELGTAPTCPTTGATADCCDVDNSCVDGDDDWCCAGQFYCSNDGTAYAESMGGILCPSTTVTSCEWDFYSEDEWRSSAAYTTCCSTSQVSMSTSLYTQLGGTVSATDLDTFVGCWCDGKLPLEQTAVAIGTLKSGVAEAGPLGEVRAMCADNLCSDTWKGSRTFAWDDFVSGLLLLGGSISGTTTQASAQDYSCTCAIGADATVGGVPQKLYQAYVDSNLAVCEAAGTCTIDDSIRIYCAYDECHDIMGTIVDGYNSIDPAWLAMLGVSQISRCSSSSDSSLAIIIVVVAGAVCLCAVVGVVALMMLKKKKSVGPSMTPA